MAGTTVDRATFNVRAALWKRCTDKASPCWAFDPEDHSVGLYVSAMPQGYRGQVHPLYVCLAIERREDVRESPPRSVEYRYALRPLTGVEGDRRLGALCARAPEPLVLQPWDNVLRTYTSAPMPPAPRPECIQWDTKRIGDDIGCVGVDI